MICRWLLIVAPCVCVRERERERERERAPPLTSDTLRRPLQQLVVLSIFTSKTWERGAESFSYFHLFVQLAHHHSSLELFPSAWENYLKSTKSRTITNFALQTCAFLITFQIMPKVLKGNKKFLKKSSLFNRNCLWQVGLLDPTLHNYLPSRVI